MQTTPTEIDDNVRRLASMIPGACSPVFLDLRATVDAEVGECFHNVEAKIKRDGGSYQNGWIVWHAPGLLIEGEFHRVWKSPSNELIDITPKADGERRILFIADSQIEYKNEIVPNVRLPLSDDPILKSIIGMKDREIDIRRQYNDGTGQSQIPLSAMYDRKKPGRNERCPCGSGKKYKSCHGRPH